MQQLKDNSRKLLRHKMMPLKSLKLSALVVLRERSELQLRQLMSLRERSSWTR